MKARISTLALLLILLGLPNTSQAAYPGYVNWNFLAGSNLFNNPLLATNNALSTVFESDKVPPGTTVSLWNPASASFDVAATFAGGSWSPNLLVPPGRGALVIAPQPFTNACLGYVADHRGNLITNEAGLNSPLPLVFAGSDGVYLVGDKMALPSNVGTNIFLNIMGRLPNIGEQVTQLSGTSTYLGNGQWDTIPVLSVGHAAFLKIIYQPVLSVSRTNGQVVVSWPASASGWILQTNGNPTVSNWGNYSGVVTSNHTTHSTIADQLYFRLLHQ